MKKLYLFMVMLFAAIAANATTLKADVYNWDFSANESVKADEQIEAEVTIDGGVISFANFLGSDLSVDVTCATDGVTHNLAGGDYAGTYNVGSFGTVGSLYFFGGGSDFEYYVEDEVKTLHLGVYAETDYSKWFNIYFYLPDDFELQEAVDPFEGLTPRYLPVNILNEDGTVAIESLLKAYVVDGTISITGLFGLDSYISYTIADDGTISSDFNNWYEIPGTGIEYNGKTYTWVYGYKSQYLSYDADKKLITDWVYLYENANSGVYASFTIDLSTNTAVLKWDNSTQSATQSEEGIYVKYSVDGNVITLPNFLGSDQTYVVTVYDDATAYHNFTAGKYEGTYSFGDFGSYGCVELYDGSIDSDYTGFSYKVDEETGEKSLYFGAYVYADSKTRRGDWYDIYIALPEDFTPTAKPDPYEGLTATELTVVFYDATEGEGDDAVAVAGTTETVTAYIDGNDVILTGLFGTKKIVYTIAEDGTITSSLNADWISSNYTYNEKNNTWIYSYGSQYLSYDAETRTITDYIWLYSSNVGFYFKITLPASESEVEGTKVPVSIYNSDNEVIATEQVTAVADEEGNITLKGLFGTESVTYTIADDGTVTSTLSGWIEANGYVFNDVANSYIAGYGDEHVTYNADNQTITDYVYFYEASAGAWFRINVSSLVDTTPTLKATVWKWDSENNKEIEAENNIDVEASIEGNVITLPNFLGSEQTFVVTVYNDNTAYHNFTAGKYSEGTYTFGEFGEYGCVELYAGDIDSNNTGFSYEEDEETGEKILHFGAYAYADSQTRRGDWYDLYFTLPASFTTAAKPDPYEGLTAKTLRVTLFDATEGEGDDKVAVAGTTEKVTAYIDGNDIILTDLFGMKKVTYTIAEDGTISSSLKADWVSSNYSYNGTNNTYVYFYGSKYLSYNAETRTITDYVWLYQSNVGFYFTIKLPKVDDGFNATIYAANADGEETSEGTRILMETTTKGDLLTVKNPFNTGFTFPFTVRNDGSIECTYGLGGFTKTFTFNDKTYARLYDYGRSYDIANNVFRWQVGFEVTKDAGDIEYYNVYIDLPDDFEATEPQVIESVKAIVYSLADNGKYKQVSSGSAKIDVKHVDDSRITITNAFGSSVSVNVAWDENGAVTVDGTMPSSQYYSIGGDYYYNITIDAANSKYVKDEQDEYIDLSFSTDAGYYYGVAYENAIYRIYLVKNSADVTTTTLYQYEYDLEADDYGEGESTTTIAYTVNGSRVTLSELLDSDLDLTVHFFTADENGDGTVETSLKAGTYEGTFYALGNKYSTLTYAGDEDAYWYTEGRSKYFWMLVTLDDQPVVLEFSIPRGTTYDEPYSDFTWDVYDWTAGEYIVNSETIKGYYEDGTITLPNFAGTGKEVTLTLYEDDAIVVTYDGTELKKAGNSSYYKANGEYLNGDFTFNETNYGQLQISKIFYELDTNNDNTTHYFGLQGWALENADSETKTNIAIYINVPEDFKAKEYEKNAVIYAVTDGVEAEEGNPVHWDITVDGSTVTIMYPFNATKLSWKFAYTMQTDGTVDASWATGGYFTTPLSFQDFSYVRLYDLGRSYDTEKRLFKWEVGLEVGTAGSGDIDYFNVYIQLPDDFTAAKPKDIRNFTTEVINEIKGREFVIETSATGDASSIDEGSISITKILGYSLNIPLSWNADGTVNTEGKYKLSGWDYFEIFEEYYQGFSIDASKSSYVKDDQDEYVDLAVTFTNGYEVADLEGLTLRIYIVKNSESAQRDDLIVVWVGEYDEEGNEVDYDGLPHYYTVSDGKLIIKDFLYSETDLEVAYYDNNTVATNLVEGTTSGSYYAFATDFTSLAYEGDAENAEWGVDDGEKYTQIEIVLDEFEYSISFYQPNNVTYTSGVNDIRLDQNGNVEYYNLQGIRINNPSNGIYIRRQGNKVSKVLVK